MWPQCRPLAAGGQSRALVDPGQERGRVPEGPGQVRSRALMDPAGPAEEGIGVALGATVERWALQGLTGRYHPLGNENSRIHLNNYD